MRNIIWLIVWWLSSEEGSIVGKFWNLKHWPFSSPNYSCQFSSKYWPTIPLLSTLNPLLNDNHCSGHTTLNHPLKCVLLSNCVSNLRTISISLKKIYFYKSTVFITYFTRFLKYIQYKLGRIIYFLVNRKL